MLQQVTPAIVVTLYKEPGQGHVVKMDSGQAKNPDVRYILTCKLVITGNLLSTIMIFRYSFVSGVTKYTKWSCELH